MATVLITGGTGLIGRALTKVLLAKGYEVIILTRDPSNQKVTKQDITNYVNKYIKDKPYVAGMIISPEMNKQLNPGEYFKK